MYRNKQCWLLESVSKGILFQKLGNSSRFEELYLKVKKRQLNVSQSKLSRCNLETFFERISDYDNLMVQVRLT